VYSAQMDTDLKVISPQPVPEDETDVPERILRTYDWGAVRLGTWQRWLDMRADDLTDEEALRHATRIRVSASRHAHREGLTVATRRREHGRVLDLRFDRKEV